MGTVKLSKLHRDALNEVMSMGMGHSSMALSRLIDEKIEVKLAALDLVPLNKVSAQLGDEEVLSTGVYLRVMGGISGTTLLVFPRDNALFLADVLVGRRTGTTKILDREDRSGLEEVGSILTASFLNAMSDFFKIKVYPSTPVTVFDKAGSIVKFVLIGVKKTADFGLFVRVNFVGTEGVIAGNFILLLDSESLEKLLSMINKRIPKGKKKKH